MEHNFKDLKTTKNPLYYMARDEIGVMEKLVKIMEFRKIGVEPIVQLREEKIDHEQLKPKLRISGLLKNTGSDTGKLLFPGKYDKKDKIHRRSIKKSVKEHLSPRGHKSIDLSGHLSPYRTSERKKKCVSVESKYSCSPTSARASKSETPVNNVRERAATTVLPIPEFFDSNDHRNLSLSCPDT